MHGSIALVQVLGFVDMLRVMWTSLPARIDWWTPLYEEAKKGSPTCDCETNWQLGVSLFMFTDVTGSGSL